MVQRVTLGVRKGLGILLGVGLEKVVTTAPGLRGGLYVSQMRSIKLIKRVNEKCSRKAHRKTETVNT